MDTPLRLIVVGIFSAHPGGRLVSGRKPSWYDYGAGAYDYAPCEFRVGRHLRIPVLVVAHSMMTASCDAIMVSTRS